jgi:sugar/nucleoside kinase (ribokinase family)
VVNTVYDFRNQKKDPDGRWPLGSDSSYPLIDLLIVDHEEALRLSGARQVCGAVEFFMSHGVSSFIITNGSKDLTVFSDGRLFGEKSVFTMPVSEAIVDALKSRSEGDTTGCGDNFVGGVLASMVRQLEGVDAALDIREACAWGIVSGGFACFYMGGTYREKVVGEKLSKMMPFLKTYINNQLHGHL